MRTTFFLILTCAATGCYYDVEETLYGSGCPDAVLTYDASIKTLMSNNCTGCHSGTNPSGGKDFTTFDAVRQATLEGSLIDVLLLPSGNSLSMPPNGALDSCSINLIQKWAAAGAPEF